MRTELIRHPAHHGAYLLDGTNQYSTSVLPPGFQGADNKSLLDATVLPVATKDMFPSDSTIFPQQYDGVLIAEGIDALQLTLSLDAVYRGALTRDATNGVIFLNGRDEWEKPPRFPTTLLCIDVATGVLQVRNHSHREIPIGHNTGMGRQAEVIAEGLVEFPVVCFLEGPLFNVYRSSLVSKSFKNASFFTTLSIMVSFSF